MKKLFLLFVASAFISSKSFSQTDTLWRTGAITALNFNQVSLTNWAAGGENSFGGNALLSYNANYKKRKLAWDNSLDLAMGGSKTGDRDIRKTDDKIDVNTKIGYDLGKNFFATYLFNFKTQFTEGFEYADTFRTRISNFLTPGYFLNAIGIDWKPNSNLSIFISPVTAKTTMVNDQSLIDLSEQTGVSLFGVEPGKKIRTEAGAYFAMKYMRNLMEHVDFTTKLELFSNYRNNPQNIDVNWQVVISLKVNKYITALIQTDLLYDNDVFVPKSDANASPGPGTQFKESFSIGFSYKFEGFGVK